MSAAITAGTDGDWNLSANATIVTSGPILENVTAELLSVYIYPFVLVIIYMVVGMVGNSVVIYIFTMQWKLTKTTVFILTLAGVDIFSCIVNMPAEAAILWHPMDFDIDALCKITRFTTFISSASSSFVLVAISIDRYLMICRPFLGRELGVRYAKKTCLVAVLLGVISTWPSLIFYGNYTFYVPALDPDTDQPVQVQGTTCLISNYYVENDKLPAGFYFFLFGGHVIMFMILCLMYIMIGRSLYMSTNPDIPQEKRHSLKYFGISMMSAITGSIPNTPTDIREKRCSFGSRSSRAHSLENVNRISIDNVHRIDHSTLISNGSSVAPQARTSTETAVSIVINDDEELHCDHEYGDRSNNGYAIHALDDDSDLQVEDKDNEVGDTEFNSMNGDAASDSTQRKISASSYLGFTSSPNKRNHQLSLDIRKNNSTGQFRQSSERFSSGSLSPMSPESVRGILMRSQSVESRSRLNRIISDELQHAEVKEFSLRRNTLILRMVTIAFVISFLPYLVIVTVRYSDPDIPGRLSKAEQIVYHVFLRTYFINSMINPFIYGFMNMEFRMKLKNLFCKACSSTNRPI